MRSISHNGTFLSVSAVSWYTFIPPICEIVGLALKHHCSVYAVLLHVEANGTWLMNELLMTSEAEIELMAPCSKASKAPQMAQTTLNLRQTAAKIWGLLLRN